MVTSLWGITKSWIPSLSTACPFGPVNFPDFNNSLKSSSALAVASESERLTYRFLRSFIRISLVILSLKPSGFLFLSLSAKSTESSRSSELSLIIP